MESQLQRQEIKPSQNKPCQEALRGDPKRFVDILAQELQEIEQLRGKRGWQDSAKQDQQQPGGGGSGVAPPTQVPAREAPKDPGAPEYADEIIREAHRRELVGLSFSGGGIRSATFNLGVLQALADFDLLNRFDYLSTVSGGGYIGSWLAAWISLRGLREVTQGLQTDRKPKPNHWEVEQIRFLREYSNYLTPRLGFFSLDTWSMITTYLRNTLLNLTILVLALGAVLVLPHAGAAVVALVEPSDHWPLLWTGILLFLLVNFMAVNIAPKIFTPECPPPPPPAPCLSSSPPPPRFACFTDPIYAQASGAVLLSAAWFLSIWLSQFRGSPAGRGWLEWAERGAVTYFVLWFLASLVALVADWNSRRWQKASAMPTYLCHAVTMVVALLLFLFTWLLALPYHDWLPTHVRTEWVIAATLFLTVVLIVIFCISRRRSPSDFWWEVIEFCATLFATPFAGALGGALLGNLISVFKAPALKDWAAFHLLVLGTPLVVVIFLLVATLHVGLMGLLLQNQKREWWSRLGGWVLVLALVWAVVCGLSLYSLPFLHTYDKKLIGQFVKWGLTPAWILSTVGGILAGKSKATGNNQKPWLEWAASLTPYVFVVGLLAGISYFLSETMTILDGVWWAPPGLRSLLTSGTVSTTPSPEFFPASLLTPAVWFVLVALAMLFIAAFLAWRVDINDFSMHLFYRNRLVRCYLGASHGTWRHPHPFTGFDPKDDVLLKEMRAEKCYSGPFPVINAALNLVKGKELAWQERKAESFVFTPLNCGFDAWIEKLMAPKQHQYAYRPTECYAYPDGGFYLGTAMSISGAAASPNMGYQSSPALAFLMTVFNVRLGWWAGNPRSRRTWERPSPWMGLAYLLSELTGNTDDESRYVYLSDGGHFENLGIYELVKRRCKFIVACDASADGDYAFGDLGNAIRKCREDIGVEIKIKTDHIFPQGTDKPSEWHCAVGEIHYENVDPAASAERPGVLVYLKSSLTSDEPADVLNYKTDHKTFPHETTVDQWFTESQFESYRRLGQHIACTVFERAWNKTGVRATTTKSQEELAKLCNRQVFENLRDAWQRYLGNC